MTNQQPCIKTSPENRNSYSPFDWLILSEGEYQQVKSSPSWAMATSQPSQGISPDTAE